MALKVGYIGLGSMGQPIATNVLQGGFELIVADLREEPVKALASLGAQVAKSPREVAHFADVVETSVVDDAQVEEIVLGDNGILAGAKPGTIVAVHSTIHPDTVRKLAPITRARGVEIIDAQVSGGAAGARGRRLCYMVGGDEALLERCRPVFATSGDKIFHMGPLGSGAAAKLAQQVITTVTMLAVSEGMNLARAAGLDLEVFEQLLRVSAGQSYMADHWLRQFGQGGTAKGIEGFYKGLIPAISLAHQLGVSVPGTALFQQLVPNVLAGPRNAEGA